MNYIKVLDIPSDKNVYYIGDIHGKYDLYKKTLDELQITSDDIVISTGDIIDRGTQNVKMLFEFLSTPNRYMVMGNHERMMIDGLTDKRWYDCWIGNGGNTTLHELGESGVKHFCELLKDLPYVLEINHCNTKVGVCHAGIPAYTNVESWSKISYFTESEPEYREQLLWDRSAIELARNDIFIQDSTKLNKIVTEIDYVIHGHTGVPHKYQFGNRIWIDTQFMSGAFTLSTLDKETKTMKFFTISTDPWGDDLETEIKEFK